MFQALIDWTNRVRQKHPFAAGNVLEIGSYNVNGSVRECFADATSYVGVDMRAGPGVDVVAKGNALHREVRQDILGRDSFDCVLAYETLEHDPFFWETLANMRSMVDPAGSGIMIVTTPTIRFPYHAHPRDYWRFTADAYRDVIFDGLHLLELDTVKDRHGNPCLCGIGRRV